MRQKLDVPLGIVVVGVVLLIGCRLIVWWPGVILGAALILGVLVPAAATRLRRSGVEQGEAKRHDESPTP